MSSSRPATPGFVADLELSQQLAEIGVMLLMSGVGLHFSLADLLAVRRIAVPGAIAQIAVATALGALTASLWGWSLGAGLVFGLALSGWLGGAGAEGTGDSVAVLTALGLTLGEFAVFVLLMVVIGRRLFPWLPWQVARTGSRELFTPCVIAAAVSIACGSAVIFGVSFALGAFFAGMVRGESSLSHRAADESLPLREAFSVLFFVSVGMLFDPAMLVQQPLRLLAVVAIIVLGKTLAAFALVLAFRYPLNTALTVSAWRRCAGTPRTPPC